MTSDYRESHKRPGKGESYHSTFSNNSYRQMVWQQEQAIIDRVLQFFLKDRQIKHLDFACGTGRILSYLENQVKNAVGVDVSKSMLKVARANNKHAEIIEEDLTKRDILGDMKFNLITAFRFFPNAQPALRKEAMGLLKKHLSESGYIVFNNHRNADSALNRLYKLFGRSGYEGMSITEVEELVAEAELEIKQVYHLSVLPVSNRNKIFPTFLLRPIETVLSHLGFLQNLGRNLIYVCSHSNSSNK